VQHRSVGSILQGGCALAHAAKLRPRGDAAAAGLEDGMQDVLRERQRQRSKDVRKPIASDATAARVDCSDSKAISVLQLCHLRYVDAQRLGYAAPSSLVMGGARAPLNGSEITTRSR